ncbi:MAG: hypothetical protein GX640_01910 [Fibrobacter sp.]|nr:hypothetical protein [Fibrobacter sp.]
MALKPVGFKLPEELIERLKNVADKYGYSQKQIVEHGIERELNRIEKEKKPYTE